MLRRMVALGLMVVLSLLTLPRPGVAEDLWSLQQQAQAYADAGNLSAAIPIWIRLVDGFVAKGGPDGYTNAALYAKDLGQAYDKLGQYDAAVPYYDREAIYWAKAGHADWGAADAQRADALRTVVRLFAQAPPAAPRQPARLEPAAGAYLGAYTEVDPLIGNDYTRAAGVLGKHPALFLAYGHWGQAFDQRYFDHARAAGAALQIALQPDAGLDQVQVDDWLTAFALQVSRAGIPVFIRFASEMNGDWVAWHGDPPRYRQKFKLVADYIHRTAPNAAMVWSPNPVPVTGIDDYYPGDDAVDWVGLSVYQDYYSNGHTDQPNTYDSPLDQITAVYGRYAGRKPLMIAEGAVAHRELATGSDRTGWAVANLVRLYAYAPLLFPRLKAVTWFDVNEAPPYGGHHVSDYSLTDSAPVLAAWRQQTASDWWLTSVPAATTPALGWKEVPAGAAGPAQSGPTTIAAYVKLMSPYVGKVEYSLNGGPALTASTPPFAVKADLAAYNGQRIPVDVTVYTGTDDPAAPGPAAGGVGTQATTRRFWLQVGAPALPDVTGHWAEAAIRRLAQASVISGYDDGSFRPEEPISREAFIKLAVAASGGAPNAAADAGFNDVPADRWSYGYVAAAVQAGLLVPDEYAGGTLDPGGPISRQELAVIAARTGHADTAAHSSIARPPLSDLANVSSAWRSWVQVAYDTGLVTGFPDGSFRPREGATRAQAAVIIGRVLDLPTIQ